MVFRKLLLFHWGPCHVVKGRCSQCGRQDVLEDPNQNRLHNKGPHPVLKLLGNGHKLWRDKRFSRSLHPLLHVVEVESENRLNTYNGHYQKPYICQWGVRLS